MNNIIILIWTLTLFTPECRGQYTVTQSPSVTAAQGQEVRINCKTSSSVCNSRGITVESELSDSTDENDDSGHDGSEKSVSACGTLS
ncbi:hypothetical protein Q8A67_025644 [Cirrhinus molitorella]|uniref:Uncharacterized protein n=1 Tax=Cirrhinus molitorella TaxID=172907 RepID=A0AA88NUY8_9TELE|nr:hypothetical protein Q8A67_025644 [Cirrhinus molitorella]